MIITWAQRDRQSVQPLTVTIRISVSLFAWKVLLLGGQDI
jgi:hypothetical protein